MGQGGVEAAPARGSVGLGSRLVEGLARELLYQGYIASRLTGITPANARRAVRMAKRSKYFAAGSFAIFMFIMLLSFSQTIGSRSEPLPIFVFIWSYAPIFFAILQVSYGISSGGQLRELLLSLPLSEGEVRRVAALSLLRALDAPLAMLPLALLASMPVIGVPASLAGLMALVAAFSAALATANLLFRLYAKAGRRLLSLTRIAVVVAIVLLFSLSFVLLQRESLQLSPWEEAFVPVLNLAGVASLKLSAMALAPLYTAAFVLLGYRSLLSASLTLLSPSQVPLPKRGSFRVRVRSPSMAIIAMDLRQLFRSPRLAGLLAVPFVYLVAALLQAFLRANAQLALFDYEVTFASTAMPIVAVSSFVAYALYLAELRGLSYLRTLPLGKFTDVKGKLMAALAFYLAAALIMGLGVLLFLGKDYFLIPLMAFTPTVAACVLYTSLYFRYVIRTLSLGALGLLNLAVYTVINLLVFGLPASVYLLMLFLKNSFMAPIPYLLIASSIELALLAYLLARQA